MDATSKKKWMEIVRFELARHSRRKATWVLFGLFMFPLFGVTSDSLANAATGEIRFNAPLLIAEGGVLMGMIALLIVAVVAGDAATRDIRTRLEPLMSVVPVSRAAYLSGRFVGVFILVAVLVATVPLAHLIVPAIQPDLAAGAVGPFRLAPYLQSYFLLMLPNAFLGTALLFGLATLARHAVASWAGLAFLFLGAQLSLAYLGEMLGRWTLATMLDPLGFTALEVIGRTWSQAELNESLIGWGGPLIWNRLLWIGIACAGLLFTYWRSGVRETADRAGWWQRSVLRHRARRHANGQHGDPGPLHESMRASYPAEPPRRARRARRDFGAVGRAWQTLWITRDSLREMAPPWALAAVPFLVAGQVLITLAALDIAGGGTPVLPTTALVLQTLGPGAGDAPPPAVLAVIMLPVILAGELVWRERDANMGSLIDAAPVSSGVQFLGKLVGLWLVIVGLYALLLPAGILAQVSLGWYDLDLGLYLRTFGLRLVIPLMFALFALSVHVLVNHKQVGHVIVLFLALGPLLLAEASGIEHPMLVLGSLPNWRYSPISGFEPYLQPLFWFALYWGAGALLLALVARLFWVRGTGMGMRERIHLARSRFIGPAVWATVTVGTLLLLAGGFVFYNTNVLNQYSSSVDRAETRAEYERRYGMWAAVPQPRIRATELHVEIHSDRRAADLSGIHLLENRTDSPLDTLHIATSLEVETVRVELHRPARAAVLDDDLGHRIYVLENPLQPGESMRLEWEVRHTSHGFPAGNPSSSVVSNGSFFVARDWMPLVGYQPSRELSDRGARLSHGLPDRAVVPPLGDPEARMDRYGREQVELVATVGTPAGQMGVAPGTRVQTWVEDDRRYARYETNAPVGNDYAIFAADYSVRSARWNDVVIEILHHPDHNANVERMVRGMEVSLEQFTQRFGPFPYDVIRMVEYPSDGGSLHAASATIWYQELFSLFDPDRDSRGIDLPFAVVAHEVAHQFQPVPARMEGQILLSESFAWYAAMGVIEEEYGTDHLQRFLAFMRESYLTPRSRADVPLLRASDAFLGYRKGPFAMYALREYIGQDRVDSAWRTLREQHASHEPPYATSLDLYRELLGVTPDSLHTLVGDLLERNTFWELQTTAVDAEQTVGGAWTVSLDVVARKVSVSPERVETDLPMDDLVEIGVYAAADGDQPGDSLYLAMHRIHSGPQTITVTVEERPARAGIDPRHLLIDVRSGDNVLELPDDSRPGG